MHRRLPIHSMISTGNKIPASGNDTPEDVPMESVFQTGQSHVRRRYAGDYVQRTWVCRHSSNPLE